MLTRDFEYELPTDLIAQRPTPQRGDSRLLVVGGGEDSFRDSCFRSLPDYLSPGDLLVLNDTRVIPARLFGRKKTGGKVEILLERLLSPSRALVQIRASKTPKEGTSIEVEGGERLHVLGRQGEFFVLEMCGDGDLMSVFDRWGHVPLPPYVSRPDQIEDTERYQTVYAHRPGAVAAPTAGLHFDGAMLAELESRGVQHLFVTLHVGAGTFQPVRTTRVEQHCLHTERFEVNPTAVERIVKTRSAGGRIVAVGTTAVRTLETAAASGELVACEGETGLFIYPGYRFQVVDCLITNFHLPTSSLLMLVCAFGGYARVMSAYRHAVAARYRFFSYGDAMLVARRDDPDLPPLEAGIRTSTRSRT